MKSYGLALLTLAALAGLGVALFALWPSPPAEAVAALRAPAPHTEPAPVVPASVDPAPSFAPEPEAKPANPPAEPTASAPTKGARITIKAGQPIPQMFPFETERKQLMSLAATQDPARIPEIASALRHADANVRETARQALIQLGDRAAIPHLEAAAAAATDADEQALLRDSIEFLSLPPLMDVITATSPSGTQS